MTRFVASLLAVVFVLLGTGSLERWHNADHAQDDRIAAAAAERAGLPAEPAPLHDENNCVTHAQLHLVYAFVAWTLLVVFLALAVRFAVEATVPLLSRQPVYSIDCRGPPAC